ncbi:MFS transporter [Streptomyces sp. NPDC051664]|uniref:MFS transporter n=1 Tax=Streptomyces sp. NPDC051664 TaxID=3365668 RepID=UPI00379A38F1
MKPAVAHTTIDRAESSGHAPGRQTNPASPLRSWLAVLAVAAGSFNLVTNEFLPVGLLSDIHRELNVTEGTAGAMVTAPGIIAAISAPLLPVALRRLDRRYALLGLSLVFVLADALAAIAPNFPTMILARAILGVGIGGFWSVAMGLGARLVSERGAQRATAIIFGGISIGTVVGVPAGPLLGHLFGWRTAFLVVAALGLVPLVLQFILLPRLPIEKAPQVRSLGRLVKSRPARLALLATLLIVTAQFSAYTFVAPFLQRYAGASSGRVSTLLLTFAIAGIVGNFVAGFALGKRLMGTVYLIMFMLGLSALAMPLLGQWSLGAFVVQAVWGISYGAVPVAMQTWLFTADESASSESGSGMFVAAYQFSIAFGSFMGGRVVDISGVRNVMYFGGGVAVAAVITIPLLLHRVRKAT